MVGHSVLFTVRRAALSSFAASTIYTDERTHRRQTSLLSLIRAYAVYTLCSVPFIVDNSPQLFRLLRAIPVASHFTDALVRVTFFDQFVGGDSALQTVPLLRRLRSQNNGALLAFSVEADGSDHAPNRPYKRIVNEIIHCIDVAADFEDALAGTRKTWVALKMTALLPDPNALVALSAHIINSRPTLGKAIAFPGCPAPHDLDVLNTPDHAHYTTRLPGSSNLPNYLPELTQADITALRELYADLVNICTRAQERGVRLVIDAEYSWYQPAIDSFAYSLMRQFNKLPADSVQERDRVLQPLVYTTFQAYLKRTPAYLTHAINDSKANNYALGVKLVRGAYHPHEIAAFAQQSNPDVDAPRRSISPDALPPVWPTRDATDECYNDCARVLIRAVRDDIRSGASNSTNKSTNMNISGTPATIAVLFGTHNWASCSLVLDELVSSGLASKSSVLEDDGAGEKEVVCLSNDVTERVTMAQLYGMSDALTQYLVGKTRSNSPFVMKYVPYGALSEVMPYLSRRAIENKSVLGAGGAAEERRWAWAGIRKKLFGWLA